MEAMAEDSIMIDSKDVKIREDLYPRFEKDMNLIEKYAESIEYLPPIIVNQDFILIDGYHRLKAYEVNAYLKGDTVNIPAEIRHTENDDEIKELAYSTNSSHGNQLSVAEKRKYANEMIKTKKKTIADLSRILSVKERTVREWVHIELKKNKVERHDKVLELYQSGWTQEAIAKEVGLTQQAVSKIITTNYKNVKSCEPENDIIPSKLFDYSHFGSFSPVYMENLLYFHTNKNDMIWDCFAGSGTTADVAEAMQRRCYLSDRKVYPAREKIVVKHDIADGLPKGLPKIDLCFLDPPYWRQSIKKYSKDAEDLGNMSLIQFNNTVNIFFNNLKRIKIPKIAIVIAPTRWNGKKLIFADHMLDFHLMLQDTYEVEARYVLQYPRPGYAVMREKAKSEKKTWVIHRDLVVYRLIDEDK
jgi:DNA modification methylase